MTPCLKSTQNHRLLKWPRGQSVCCQAWGPVWSLWLTWWKELTPKSSAGTSTYTLCCMCPSILPPFLFCSPSLLIFSHAISLYLHFAPWAEGGQLSPATSSLHGMLHSCWPKLIKWTNQGQNLLKPWIPKVPFLLGSWASPVFGVPEEIWLPQYHCLANVSREHSAIACIRIFPPMIIQLSTSSPRLKC